MIRRLRAFLGGWFWLPCPVCGCYFAGFEAVHDPADEGSIPKGPPRFTPADDVRLGFDSVVVESVLICPTCARAGVGRAAWVQHRATHGSAVAGRWSR